MAAQEAPPNAGSRFPGADGNPPGTRSIEGSPAARPKAVDGASFPEIVDVPIDQYASPVPTSRRRRQAIRRTNRLAASDDFQRARREGQSWAARAIVLRAVPNSLDRTRFGFAVGKRIGKATVRNRIRRLMREAIRHRVSDIAPGWDVVLIAREGIRDTSFVMVDRMVEQLLRRASLLPPDEDQIDRAATGPGTH